MNPLWLMLPPNIKSKTACLFERPPVPWCKGEQKSSLTSRNRPGTNGRRHQTMLYNRKDGLNMMDPRIGALSRVEMEQVSVRGRYAQARATCPCRNRN